MGKSIIRKMITVTLALALVLTSGIGVFAAGSPTVGKVTKVTSQGSQNEKSLKIVWSKQGNADKYIVKVGDKSYTVKGTSYTAKVKANKTYKITVTPVYGDKKGKAVSANKRWTKTTKITKAKAGKKKVTLTWKKAKGATKYQVYQLKGGKWKVVKTVKKTSATIKVGKKGTYKFRVRPIKGSYIGIESKVKSGKAK